MSMMNRILDNSKLRFFIISLLCVAIVLCGFSYTYADDATLVDPVSRTSSKFTFSDYVLTIKTSSWISGSYLVSFADWTVTSGQTYTLYIPEFSFPYGSNYLSTPLGKVYASDLPVLESFTANTSSYTLGFGSDSGSSMSGASNNDTVDFPVYLYSGIYSPPVYPTSNYSLPCGNALYIELSESATLGLKSTFYELSPLIGSDGNWFPDTAFYTTSSSLPVGSDVISSGTVVPWSKSDTGRNIFGQTKYAVYDLTYSGSDYLVIVNPLTFYNGTTQTTPSLTITGIPYGSTIYSYPLFTSVDNGEQVSSVSTTEGGIGYAGSDGGSISTVSTSDSSSAYDAPVGGTNYVDSELSPEMSISSALEKLVSLFEELFSKPVSYIQRLISAGSSFMQSLVQMFSWLPGPVIEVITGGLVLMVVIGVLKMLL